MKRLIIIVEGQTEEEFVNQSLRKYLYDQGVFQVSAIKISTSRGHKGGFVNYQHLYNDIQKVIVEPNVVVSTFLDFYAIPSSVPQYSEMLKTPNYDAKVDVLEEGMRKSINNYKFVPYIQKFEFETLLFSNNAGFEEMTRVMLLLSCRYY